MGPGNFRWCETGPRPGNERGLSPDRGGGGDYPKKSLPGPCRGGASRGKTRPAPSRNEHYATLPILPPASIASLSSSNLTIPPTPRAPDAATIAPAPMMPNAVSIPPPSTTPDLATLHTIHPMPIASSASDSQNVATAEGAETQQPQVHRPSGRIAKK